MKKFLNIVFLALVILLTATTVSAAESVLYCASPTGEQNMHISPDKESYVLDAVPSCTKISLIKKDGIWGLINISGKTGWINLSFTREDYASAAEATGKGSEKTLQIIKAVDKVSLYSLPTDSEKAGTTEKYSIPSGTILKIVRETESGWGLVPMKDDYAWIKMENAKLYRGKYIPKEDSGIYYVYTKAKSRLGANLYAQNGGIILKVIPNCIRLTVRERRGSYLYTSYDGINGWVKESDVTISQEDARTNVGTKVNEEYVTTVASDIYNIPSSQKVDGAVVLGSISDKKRVFVQRITYDGWLLINNDGIVGWIPPESAEKDISVKEQTVEMLEKFAKGYIASEKSEGAKLYASPDGKDYVLTVPECVLVEAIAQKDGYLYARCDYASGWIKKECIKENFGEALLLNLSEKEQVYYIKENTPVMSLPAQEASFGSERMTIAKKGARVTVSKTVTGGKTKWGYVSVDGVNGWINLAKMRKEMSPLIKIAVVVIVVLMVVAIMILFVKKRGIYKNGKENV